MYGCVELYLHLISLFRRWLQYFPDFNLELLSVAVSVEAMARLFALLVAVVAMIALVHSAAAKNPEPLNANVFIVA